MVDRFAMTTQETIAEIVDALESGAKTVEIRRIVFVFGSQRPRQETLRRFFWDDEAGVLRAEHGGRPCPNDFRVAAKNPIVVGLRN